MAVLAIAALVANVLGAVLSSTLGLVNSSINKKRAGLAMATDYSSYTNQEFQDTLTAFNVMEDAFAAIDDANAIKKTADDMIEDLENLQTEMGAEESSVIADYTRQASATLSDITNFWSTTGLMSSETLAANMKQITSEIDQNKADIIKSYQDEITNLTKTFIPSYKKQKRALQDTKDNAWEDIGLAWEKMQGDEIFTKANTTYDMKTGKVISTDYKNWDPKDNFTEITEGIDRYNTWQGFAISAGSYMTAIGGSWNPGQGRTKNWEKLGAMVRRHSENRKIIMPMLFRNINEQLKKRGKDELTWDEFQSKLFGEGDKYYS